MSFTLKSEENAKRQKQINMQVQVNAPFQVNDYLQDVIDEKIGKLKTYYDRILEADVYLKIGEKRHRHAEEQIVELRVNVPGHTFFAEEKSDQFEKAVAAAADKIRRQLLRHKRQLNNYNQQG